MNNLPAKLNFPVIEEGKEVVRPDVMTAVTQLAQLAQLVKLRRLEESKIPIGLKLIKKTVTDSIMKLPLYPPWISFSLINDGAGAVTVWVNDDADPLVESMIPSGEGYNCNFDYPVIKSVYLKAASGTTAAVRILGKEGKP